MAADPLDDLAKASRDLAHITIGLGVLTFQKVQVQRRSIERAFAAQQSEGAGTAPGVPTELLRRSLHRLRDCR